jgi:signal transduction histidine kinase
MRNWLARWLARRPAAGDAALAVALLAACLVVNAPSAVLTADTGPVEAEAPAVWWTATALGLAAVALRRRWPVPMLAAASLAAAAHVAYAVPLMVVDLAVPILVFTVAARHGRVVARTALGVLLLAVTGWSLYAALNAMPVPGLPDRFVPTPPGPAIGGPAPASATRPRGAVQDTWSGVLVLGSVLVASYALGQGSRTRRAYLHELHARAEDLERERDQRAVLAVTAERARISRDLHDVVAHGLSVMVTQAQGAEAALDRRPDDARTALAAIVSTGRDSLADMRRVLSRVDGVEDVWHPQPGLDRLPALAAQVTEAGLPVRLMMDGVRPALSSTVDLSAYRIVQEALTNALKHAGPHATAQVTVSCRGSGIEIEVRDDGVGPGAVGAGAGNGGQGLRGMRERATLLGGRFSAGPAIPGGFVVRAALPVSEPAA